MAARVTNTLAIDVDVYACSAEATEQYGSVDPHCSAIVFDLVVTSPHLYLLQPCSRVVDQYQFELLPAVLAKYGTAVGHAFYTIVQILVLVLLIFSQ